MPVLIESRALMLETQNRSGKPQQALVGRASTTAAQQQLLGKPVSQQYLNRFGDLADCDEVEQKNFRFRTKGLEEFDYEICRGESCAAVFLSNVRLLSLASFSTIMAEAPRC